MSDEVLIDVQGVSKKFCRQLKKSLWYGLQDLGNELRGHRHGGNGQLRPEEFWAVRDISFQVKRGECLGLIGRNGAGKSTLLKILNGLLKPDEGRIRLRGRVGALIELGGGFNPILSGRENIYIGGSVFGFSRAEMDKKLDEIIDFSEIEEFIDMPVRNYSSGMKVRLGFSVAVHLDPDILYLDEVLAVGDAGFKLKSYNKMNDLLRRAAVVFVSHSMPIISRTTNRVILLKDGGVAYQGDDVAYAIEQYMGLFGGEEARIEYNEKAILENFTVRSLDRDLYENGTPVIHYMDDLLLEFDATILDDDSPQFEVDIEFVDKDMKAVASYGTRFFDQTLENTKSTMRIAITIPKLMLVRGEYSVIVTLMKPIPESDSGRQQPDYLANYRHFIKIIVRGFRGAPWAPFLVYGEASVV